MRSALVPVLAVLVGGCLLALTVSAAALASGRDTSIGQPRPGDAPANPACLFGGSGGTLQPIAAAASADPSVVRVVATSDGGQPLNPLAIAIDTGDPRGRVFVTDYVARAVTAITGRSLDPADIRAQSTTIAGGLNAAIAVDPTTGHVFVMNESGCQIVILDGRATPPAVIGTLDLPGVPSDLAVDPVTDRLYVALADLNEVLAYGPDMSVAPVAVPVSGGPRRLVVDSASGLVFVARSVQGVGGSATGGSIGVIDGRATPSSLVSETPADLVTALAVDPASRFLFAVDLASASQRSSLRSFSIAASGVVTPVSSVVTDADPAADAAATIAVLPASHDVLVPLAESDHANLFSVGSDGALHLVRAVAGIVGGTASVVDPATGRVFVAEPRQGAVAVAELDVAAAPSITVALPGPLEISLAPQDVARSVGITALLMLLLGMPTPLFNSTLTAKRPLIERWMRRKLPRRLAPGKGGARAGRRLAALSGTWTGMFSYLLLVGVLYAFLNKQFPGQNAALTLGTTLFGIAAGTALSQLPAELYVRRRHHARGTIKVALWTLALAAGCVLITRLTGVQPGYVYGIIGGFTFTVALTSEDRGRMAFNGMAILLAVGFIAWLVRIPFEPTVGIVGGGVGLVGNAVLANLFVSAVQGAAIGLLPLRFLTGASLFRWSRWRWGVLWALALVLFAHVILYPVSSLEPHPSSSGLWTVAVTVVVYGGIALAFWGFFRNRDQRREVRRTRGAAAGAPRSTT